MDSMRVTTLTASPATQPCSRCQANGSPWDTIAAKIYCPGCQEALIIGEADPLVELTEPRRCAVCSRKGTLRFCTIPFHSQRQVEVDLCGEHLRALLARRLGPLAYQQLRRQLGNRKISVQDVFLLHEAFYDEQGHALRPALEAS